MKLINLKLLLLITTVFFMPRLVALDKAVIVSTADVLSIEKIEGPYHKINDEIYVHGYMNHYTVESEFGTFYPTSDLNLEKLLIEIQAIQQLKKVKKSKAFGDAILHAAVRPLEITGNVLTHPIRTVKKIPVGLKHLFTRTSFRVDQALTRAKSRAKSRAKAKANKTSEENLQDKIGSITDKSKENFDKGADYVERYTLRRLGYNKAIRKWSEKYGIDPYSTNKALQDELSHVAWVSAAGSFGASMVISLPQAYDYVKHTNSLVWKLDPLDLKMRNIKMLIKMGVKQEQIDAFYDNDFLTPTSRTQIINAFETLQMVENSNKYFLTMVNIQSIEEAVFYARSMKYLAMLHRTTRPIKSIVLDSLIPMAVTQNEQFIAVANVDYLIWDEKVINFLSPKKSLITDRNNLATKELYISGILSPDAESNLKNTNWIVYENAFF